MGTRPLFAVAHAVVVDGTHVRVNFTCAIDASESNKNPANFTFTGTHALIAQRCSGVGNDYIEVEVNEMKPDTQYTVTARNVRDVFSRKIVKMYYNLPS